MNRVVRIACLLFALSLSVTCFLLIFHFDNQLLDISLLVSSNFFLLLSIALKDKKPGFKNLFSKDNIFFLFLNCLCLSGPLLIMFWSWLIINILDVKEASEKVFQIGSIITIYFLLTKFLWRFFILVFSSLELIKMACDINSNSVAQKDEDSVKSKSVLRN